MLFLELPSGRRLAFVKPAVVDHDKWPGKKKNNISGRGLKNIPMERD